MRLRVIACEILARETYHLAARAGRIVDVSLLPKGLHGLGAERMRERLQAEIDATDASRYGAVALAYALCSRGTEGLVARDVPLVIPRAHDCITLLLGSRARYSTEFDAHPGTYYYSAGWHERDREEAGPAGSPSDLGPGVRHDLGIDRTYEDYVEQYGEETARYIVEKLRGGLEHYERLLFIEMGLGGEEAARAAAAERAEREGWRLETTRGDLGLLRRLLEVASAAHEGQVPSKGSYRSWSDGGLDFVVVMPGESVVATYDDRIMERAPCPSACGNSTSA